MAPDPAILELAHGTKVRTPEGDGTIRRPLRTMNGYWVWTGVIAKAFRLEDIIVKETQ